MKVLRKSHTSDKLVQISFLNPIPVAGWYENFKSRSDTSTSWYVVPKLIPATTLVHSAELLKVQIQNYLGHAHGVLNYGCAAHHQ
jgi:hypothetical protein